MVNKHWLEQIQKAKQKEIIAKLKSGEVIIQDSKIILNQTGLRKQQGKEKQAERRGQQEGSGIEGRLTELEKGEKSM